MEAHTHKGHSHGAEGVKGIRLLFVVLLNILITAVETVGGVLSGSLSLITDALHNLSDVLAVVISYYAIKISQRQGDAKKTFGYRRASILAALLNSTVLIGISIFLLREAWEKFQDPREIDGMLVIWVALVSLAANFFSLLLLRRSVRGDMNLKSTYLHLLSDTLTSLGVIVAGALILLFKAYWVDPVLTVIISLYILWECVAILRKAVNILMQGVPDNMDIGELEARVGEIPGVAGVHHVHVWCLDENHVNFEAHVDVQDMAVSCTREITKDVERMLHEKYGISHVTLQYEAGWGCEGGDCPAGGECPVRKPPSEEACQ